MERCVSNALKCENKIISELFKHNSLVDFMKRMNTQLDRESSSLSVYLWGIISDCVNDSLHSKDEN